MERQEFDLSDYSLEVRDGKAVLERKEGFKPGNVLSGVRQIAIYADTAEDGTIITYCGYDEIRDIFTDKKDVSWGYTKDFRYATKEQEKMLFAEIEKRGYVWDAEKLELRRKGFKVGDFICFGDGNIGICNSAEIGEEGFKTRCHLSGNKFVSHCERHSDKKVCLATVAQRQRLLDAIDRNGFVWFPETLELKKKYEFDDGAFVVDDAGGLFIHYKGGDTDYSHGSYVYWNRANDDITFECCRNMTIGVRLVTGEEGQSLLDRLAKEDYEWDSEKKMLRKRRWRAKKGEGYWIVASHGKVERYAENVTSWDDEHYSIGNYFRTKEEAEQAAEEVRDVFEKYKEE